MNQTISLLQHHHSDRSFTDQPIDDAILDEIITAAHLAPTSFNSQQVSLVVVKDQERRDRIAEIAGGQPWVAKAPVFIAVILDLYKTEVALNLVDQQQAAPETVEGLVSGCTDVGIILATLMSAARSYELGIVPIGGIRRDPQSMIKLLSLPKHTFPVVGVSIGHIDEPAYQKPRLDITTFRHNEYYRSEGLAPSIEEYDQRLTQYWQHINRQDGLSWSANLATAYPFNYFPNVYPSLLRQGFKLDK
jgi:FMN reductase [NAD(P)H]